MNQHFIRLAFLSTLAFGCSDQGFSEKAAGSGHLRIEMACASDAACPAKFECESETEHGVTTSFCQSHDEAKPDGTGAQCPTGYELEVEHGTSFCKPHGGDDDSADDGSGDDSSGRGGSDDDATDDSGSGGGKDDDAADGTEDRGSGGERGDDRGGDSESGDDKGSGGNEPGDDHGGGGEGGDDHGGSGHG